MVVVQGAKALTVSNRRTVGRGYPKGRECPLVMGVSGELEGSPDLVMQRPNGALALTGPDHLGTGLGKCQRLGGCNGGAQRPPCQDGVGQEIFEFPCSTTHILQSALSQLFVMYYALCKYLLRARRQISELNVCGFKFVLIPYRIKRVSTRLLVFRHYRNDA